MIAGVVLAGGRSSRFGREKAVAELEGDLLIDRVVRVLAGGCDVVAVNAPAASGAAAFAAARALPHLPDEISEATGPLSGIRAGLGWARSQGCDWLATAPCDTPFLPADMVRRLYAVREAGGAVARTAEGLQPLCALWPASALELINLIPGHPPVSAVLESLGATEVAFADASAFANLNTPEDHARARMRPG